MPIEALRAFSLVVETGGFTPAAERLHVTQSAVSWRIKRLEDRIGRPLLTRASNRVVPTDDGRELLVHARRILSAHDEAVAWLRGPDLVGSIRIGATEMFTAEGLADFMRRFGHRHPRLQLGFRLEQSRVLRDWLERGEIDLAVFQVTEHDLHARDRVLREGELVWATRPGGTAIGDPVHFVSFGPNCFYRPLAEQALAATGRRLRSVIESPSLAGVRSAVAAGLGIALLDRRSILPDLTEQGRLQQECELPAVFDILRTRSTPLTRATEVLADAIVEEWGASGGTVHAGNDSGESRMPGTSEPIL